MIKQKVELVSTLKLEKFEIDKETSMGMDSEIIFEVCGDKIYLKGELYDCIGLDYVSAMMHIYRYDFKSVEDVFNSLDEDFKENLCFLRFGRFNEDGEVDWGEYVESAALVDKEFYENISNELLKEYLKYHM